MNTVLIPLPDGRTLGMDLKTYQEALSRGAEISPMRAEPQAEHNVEVLDAHGMESRTGVPASWWFESARRGDVPHIRAGKYVRFDFAAAMAVLEKR